MMENKLYAAIRSKIHTSPCQLVLNIPIQPEALFLPSVLPLRNSWRFVVTVSFSLEWQMV